MNYPGGQDTWTDAKKDKYEKNILRAFCDPKYNDLIGTFTMITKSGEVCRSPYIEEENGFVVNQRDRPRGICVPCDRGCGLI